MFEKSKRILSLVLFYKRRRYRGNNFVISKNTLFKRTKISFMKDCINNKLIANNSTFHNGKIMFRGSSNSLIVEDGVSTKNITIIMSGNGNIIKIGKRSWFNLDCCIEAGDGTMISIGSDCQIGCDVVIMSTDAHKIFTENKRSNVGKNVTIGNNVWVARDSLILKGTEIKNNCVIGAGTFLSGKEIGPRVVVYNKKDLVIRNIGRWEK